MRMSRIIRSGNLHVVPNVTNVINWKCALLTYFTKFSIVLSQLCGYVSMVDRHLCRSATLAVSLKTVIFNL